MAATKPEEKKLEKIGKMSYPIEDYTPPYSQSKHDLRSSYAWDGLLSRSDVLAAPVKAFRHVSHFIFQKIVKPSNLLRKSYVFTRKIHVYFPGSNERLLAKYHRWNES